MDDLAAIFIIEDIRAFESRKSFALLGELVLGELQFGDNGNEIRLYDRYGVSLKIQSVEAVYAKHNPALLGLMIKYNDEKEMGWIKGLKSNRVVYIKWMTNIDDDLKL